MTTAVKVSNPHSIIDLSAVLTVERIQVKSDTCSKKRVLELVSQLISQALPEYDYKDIFEQFIAREKLGSTAIGHGIAIPHIRLDGIDQTIAALVTLQQPVDFNGPEKLSADLIFALVVPADFDQQHLDLLKTITQQLHSKTIQEALRTSDTAEMAYHLLITEDQH
ncbi:MAG: PTS transporter subunit EIIA [Gammaproteobacteria bacterium]|nr:PTS transporter subunit EIIA [Gammaproteobacteria bacterium]